MRGVRLQIVFQEQPGGAAEHDKVNERVGAETVCTVNGSAARFAHSHQAGCDATGIFAIGVQHFTPIVGRNAAHIVVNRRQNRDRFTRHVHAREDVGAAALFEHGWGVMDTTNGGVGLPILGYSVQKLTNPSVAAGVSGNFGITWAHRFAKVNP